ncbi:aldose 1-epimerase family protein [Rathayibacter toxicus]|uniref:aldose 1-epimerase family protein n=1 Tax=Rathayibacter toxicus TaxID=145458 RepID=UPI000CE8E051|nr:aldose 1-epimerase family protein [Rathayibacter toxicus]PPI56189.1 aldose epimerase [Rathayibacter toxicus]QOD10013.1 aldose 1-epimerase family protein [Rathayibacter toxicus]QWL28690.1 aldose epimerase [Rathayibacter toxicus]QWL30777.1 aldose epimerase [Rathayibacter toxicus]
MVDFVPAPATGRQHLLELTAAGRTLQAVVTEVAAGLRRLTVDGVEITASYPESMVAPLCAGAVLVPWPNRVRDGRWSNDGVEYQLDLTEPARGNAIHGLLRNTSYRLVERGPSWVELAAPVVPQNGYPFHLATTVRYELRADGLAVQHQIVSVGAHRAPVAIGTHPFIAIGDTPTDELELTLDAAVHIEVDDRLNPVGHTPVEGTAWDLRSGRRVGDLELDDAWAEVTVTDGESVHGLRAADGRRVLVWADPAFCFLQAFITREFPHGDGVTTAVALEPMTAPANALNTGHGLRWLAPGEEWCVSWGIRHEGFPVSS